MTTPDKEPAIPDLTEVGRLISQRVKAPLHETTPFTDLVRSLGHLRVIAGCEVMIHTNGLDALAIIHLRKVPGEIFVRADDESQEVHVSKIRSHMGVTVPGLYLNGLTRQIECDVLDTFYVPEPGKPRRTKSPITAIVETILEIAGTTAG